MNIKGKYYKILTKKFVIEEYIEKKKTILQIGDILHSYWRDEILKKREVKNEKGRKKIRSHRCQ